MHIGLRLQTVYVIFTVCPDLQIKKDSVADCVYLAEAGLVAFNCSTLSGYICSDYGKYYICSFKKLIKLASY